MSASLCAGATYSGRPSGAEKSQADHRVASEQGYAASCIPTSENLPPTHSGEYSSEQTRRILFLISRGSEVPCAGTQGILQATFDKEFP
jgi:hypothetical protein